MTEPREIDLGPTTGLELLIGGYEATKDVLASAIASLGTDDALKAKELYAKLCSDIDNRRAEFILKLRENPVDGLVD